MRDMKKRIHNPDRDQYVYTWSDPITGIVRYVGRGVRKRPFSKNNRKPKLHAWMKSFEKNGVCGHTVHITKNSMTFHEADKIESYLIHLHKRICDGGTLLNIQAKKFDPDLMELPEFKLEQTFRPTREETDNLPIHFVYTYADPDTGIMRYVGCGRDYRHLAHTWNTSWVQPETTRNPKFYSWIKSLMEQKKNPIIIKVKEDLTKVDAIVLEKELTRKYGRTIDGGTLFNKKIGASSEGLEGIGMSGKSHSEEAKKKMSIARQGRPTRRGFTHSTESKKLMSDAAKRRIIPIEQRIKIGISRRGQKDSLETKKKKSDAAKRRYAMGGSPLKSRPKGRKICQRCGRNVTVNSFKRHICATAEFVKFFNDHGNRISNLYMVRRYGIDRKSFKIIVNNGVLLGYMTKEKCRLDGRVIYYSITPEGHAHYQRLTEGAG